MYSYYQRERALQLYDQYKSVSKVVQKMGYPTRKRIYDWIAECNSPPKSKLFRKRFNNTPDHPRHPPLQLKLETIHRYFGLGESVQYSAEEIGCSGVSIYTFRKKYILRGAAVLINYDDKPAVNCQKANKVHQKNLICLNPRYRICSWRLIY